MISGGKGGSLCWYCKNALGGCVWSKRLEPVDGWYAQKTTTNRWGYWVGWCPEWVPDEGLHELLTSYEPMEDIQRNIFKRWGRAEPMLRLAVMRYHRRRLDDA